MAHSYSDKPPFLKALHFPSLPCEGLKSSMSLEAFILGYSYSAKLVDFLCNEFQESFLHHIEGFLLSPCPTFVFIALEKEVKKKWIQEIILL